MKRRCLYDQLADIIAYIICKDGARTTYIHYDCRISPRRIRRYLAILVENGLLIRRKNGLYYQTNKGTSFIHAYIVMTKYLTLKPS